MSDPIKITNLCENTVYSRNLIGEHGLSLLLEAHGKKILFDTGAGMTLLPNCQTLGVELQKLDAVVLSHGHYDHTGGLATLVETINPKPVYAHPDIFGAKFSMEKNKEYQFIGIPWLRQDLEEKGIAFCLSREPVEIAPGVTLTGEIARMEQTASGDDLLLKTEAGMIKDPLLDDQAIVVESPKGLVVLLGCAHAGLINTLRYIQMFTGQKQFYALLGGTHLLDLPAPELNQTIENLQDFGLQKIAPCHCTGLPARLALYRAFGSRVLEHRVGSVFYL